MTDRWVTLAEALATLPGPGGARFSAVMRHGTMELEIYAPKARDPQKPHSRDEVYIVARGRGQFQNGPVRHAVAQGDVLFVPAGVEHRFEEFSDDFVVWVIFYGPEGGERSA